jgi:hypothetical protein
MRTMQIAWRDSRREILAHDEFHHEREEAKAGWV